MAIGFSNQTSPFEFCHSCHRSSSSMACSFSCSFWLSSKKALNRRKVDMLKIASCPSTSISMFSSSFQFRHRTSYNTMPYSGYYRHGDTEYYHSPSSYELDVPMEVEDPTSSGRMLPGFPNRSSYEGKFSYGGSGLGQQKHKRHFEKPSCMDTPGRRWCEVTEEIRKMKREVCCDFSKSTLDHGISVPECKDLEDGSSYEYSNDHTVPCNREFDDMVSKSDGGSSYYRVYKGSDQISLLLSMTPYKPHSQQGTCVKNGVLSGLSTEVGLSGNRNDVTNNMHDHSTSKNIDLLSKHLPSYTARWNTGNGPSRSSMGPEPISSDPLSRKHFWPSKNSISQENLFPGNGAQPNDSSLGEEEKKEINFEQYEDGATDAMERNVAEGRSAVNETYVEQITADVAQGVNQPHLRERLGRIYDKVFVVANISAAKEIVGMLTNQYRHLVHACHTEAAKIDVNQETPIGHGEIICFSIYPGAEANFGNDKSCVWVDVLDGGGRGLLAEFAPFFEDPSIKKVWHNYSLDNHVIENYGLKVSGFHADTMHMARLWDSSRRAEGGYSLEALTSDPCVMNGARSCLGEKLIGKVSIKTIFARRKVKKDGSEGKLISIPPVEELQRVERKSWICYSALDSISTLQLYESLRSKLSNREWILDGVKQGTMFHFYEKFWRPFGELLVEMETEGMLVDRAYLAEVEKVAKAEQQVAANEFLNWASKYCPDAKYMNVGSDAQLRQLFFGGTMNRKNHNECLPEKRDFKVPNVNKVIEESKKAPTKYRKITLHSLGVDIETEMYTTTGWPSVSGDALRTLAGRVSAEFDFADEAHKLESDENVEDFPETMNDELSDTKKGTSCGEPDICAYGTAYSAFGGGQEGIEACHAIASLCKTCSIDSLISNFIIPLQGNHVSGKNGRIHCSLNINTETGRLSARRPNLQNQPALEKDRYKIRQAFMAAPGNSLIVADYGQLELRILAHLANCKSMLDAFKAGGDFHSRTAMNMYPYIRDAIEQKHVLLEWHSQPGEDKPCVPLLKDAFASERRKAKMLNFSIAYGKTMVGLARDWKVSVKEAKETVDCWYSDRKEVLQWQKDRKKEASKDRCVYTLLGRARWFPSMSHVFPSQKAHIERAAINTPVQGSAADVVMCAMLEISKNALLKELGWSLLLQVHDEVILEGPTESAEVAKAIVVDCMSKPFDGKNILRVDLSVDAKCAPDWYSAK